MAATRGSSLRADCPYHNGAVASHPTYDELVWCHTGWRRAVNRFETGNRLLDAALTYASYGWPVAPLHTPRPDGKCDCRKPECSSPGKHPRLMHGLKDATTDARQISEWWGIWKTANVGVCTGRHPGLGYGGLAVIDVDPRHDGTDSLLKLMADADLNVATVTARTGSGGMHLLYEMRDLEIHNSANLLGPGLDVRGLGGYIVAPPSLHASGGRYEWVPGEGPADMSMLPFPEAAWALLSARRPSLPTPRDWTTGPTTIREGQRNVMLASLGGTMRRRGMEEPEILAALLKVNERRCSPPLPEADVDKIAWSVARYSPDNAECPVQPGGVSISAAVPA